MDNQELTDGDINQLLDKYLRDLLRANEVDRATNGYIPDWVRRHERVDFEYDQFYAQQALASNDLSYADTDVALLLAESGIELDKETDTYKKLCRGMLQTRYQYLDIELARNQGDYGKELPAPPVSPLPELEDNGKLLSEVMAEHVAEKGDSGAWVEKTRATIEAIYSLALQILGDKPFKSLKRGEWLEYRETLRKLPANLNKSPRYRGKLVQDILAMDDIEPMNDQTVNKYVEKLSALCNWAVKLDYADRNYAEGLRLKLDTRPDEERAAWSKAELRTLFDSPVYREHQFTHPWQFWVPLVCAFSGMRLGEVAQLHLQDLRQEDKVWLFDIHGEPPRKLKTKAAKRLVPVHPVLIEAGLLDYADKMRRLGHERLFPEIKQKGGAWSNYPSEWFNQRYRPRIGLERNLHELRHTFANALYESGVSHDEIGDIVGHSNSKITARYAKRKSPKATLQVVEKLDYRLNLQHVRWREGG